MTSLSTKAARASRLSSIAAAAVLAVVLAANLAPAHAAWQSSTPAQLRPGLDQAYALLQSGKFEEAVAAFQGVLEHDPENRTARLELAYLNGRLGRWTEAVKQFVVVVQKEPENLRLRMDYGYALEKAGTLEQSVREFQFVADHPGEFQSQAQAALEAVRAQLAAAASRENIERVARRDAFLNRGYRRLREGDRAGARYAFEAALREDPSNSSILKQLGYLAIEAGHPELAVEKFAKAHELAPDDATVALQLGYLYDRLGQPEKAAESFESAAGSADAPTRRSAQTALRNIRANQPGRVYLDVYAAPLYATRFDNGIAQFQAQLHWRQPGWPVTLYLSTRITHDSRSRGGTLPAVFSDNVALLGTGISFRPRRTNLTFLAEANLAFNLTQTVSRNREVEPDYRVALYYYRRWDARLYGPVGAVTLGRLHNERLFTDLDTSLGYYSRYHHNGIAYLQLREGMQLANWGTSRFYGYGKVNLAKDTNRDFFNNVGEFGAGLEFRPHANLNLGLRMEYLRGIYYGIEGKDPNPFRRQYNDFRVMLLFGRRFRIK